MQIKGIAEAYFETGTEGTYWAVQDENHPRDYQGLHIIRPNDHITVHYKDNQGDLYKLLDVEVELIDSIQAEKNKYFRQYLRAHQTGWKQLNFAGFWVHKLPTNVDLGLWYQIFLGGKNHDYVTTLTPALKKTTSIKDVLKLFGV